MAAGQPQEGSRYFLRGGEAYGSRCPYRVLWTLTATEPKRTCRGAADGDAARFRFSGGGTPSPMVVAACSDWYRNPDGVGELGLERQVGSSLCFLPGNGLASSLMYLRPWVSNAVLGLRTGLVVVTAARLRGRCYLPSVLWIFCYHYAAAAVPLSLSLQSARRSFACS